MRMMRRLGTLPWSLLLTGSGVLVLLASLVRAVCQSPYAHGVMLQGGSPIPSPPLMSLAWTVWYALLGATFVATLLSVARLSAAFRADVYRGGMLFLCMILLGFFWYPLFFVAGRQGIALIVLLAVLALCLLSALCYVRILRLAAAVLLCHALWLAWLVTVSVRVLFC